MTYRELLNELKSISEEQLNQTVTVYVSGDDYFPVDEIGVYCNTYVTLEADQLVLVTGVY